MQEPIRLEIGFGPFVLRLELSAGTTPAVPASAPGGAPPAVAGPACPPPRPASLRELIPQLLERTGPLKASTIARRLGRCNSGHFRDCLHMLVEEGKVVRVAGATYGVPEVPAVPPPPRNGGGRADPSEADLAERVAAARKAKAGNNGAVGNLD